MHDFIHILQSHFLSGVSIVTSLNDTSTPRVREHLHSCLYLANPCAKRKVLSLTKPKGKIYKTKSLGHYITHIPQSSRTGTSSTEGLVSCPGHSLKNLTSLQQCSLCILQAQPTELDKKCVKKENLSAVYTAVYGIIKISSDFSVLI